MDSNLYKTIKSGDIDGLKQILSAANLSLLHQTTPLRNTILHVAVQFESSCFEEIYRICPSLLIQANSKGDTPLHIAARLGFTDAVSFFIQQSKINRNDIDVSSTLTRVQQLLRMGNEENDTALHEAVRNHNFQIVKKLTEADPSFEYFANKAGETPLYLAVEAELFNFADQILQTCPSSAHVGPLGRTALHIAAMELPDSWQFWYLPSDIISLLLEKKPSIIKEVDDFGLSALHYAAHYHIVGRVVQLLEADPSVAYIRDKAGKTALHYAAKRNGGIETIEQLIEHSPDCWELLDNEGRNFLHFAAERGTDDVFKHFMSNYSHQSNNRMMENLINQPDINGNTPLHLAIKSERYDIAKIICKHNGVRKIAMNKDNLLNLVDPSDKEGMNYSDLYKLGARKSWRMKHIHGDGEGDKEPIDVSDDFVAFVISNSTAMLLSSFTVLVHFCAKLMELLLSDNHYTEYYFAMTKVFIIALVCTFGAIIAMVVAFVTGTYTVLLHLPGLAIPLCIFGCSFFIFCWLLNHKLKKWTGTTLQANL